jgi:XTP/dITP diphosphohydrolase
MTTLLFASNNRNKLREVSVMSARYGVQIIAADDLVARGAVVGAPPEVDETANSYSGNAVLKADAWFAWAGMPVLADDSGIEVSALGGGPGVYSARYAGSGATAEMNNVKLLDALSTAEDRRAALRSLLVAKLASGTYLMCDGVLEGEIAREPRGKGWGYEPIFFLREYGRTLAELKDEGIAVTTHRMQALERMGKLAGRYFEERGDCAARVGRALRTCGSDAERGFLV